MKKTIALFLAVIMLAACMPLSASAANLSWDGNQTFSGGTSTISAGNTVTVTGNIVNKGDIVVEYGATLVIGNGATLVVNGSGRIINNGNIVVDNGGTLNLASTGKDSTNCVLSNSGKITVKSTATCIVANGAYVYNAGTIENVEGIIKNGTINHKAVMPVLTSASYSKTETWNRKDTTVNFQVKYFYYNMDLEAGGDNDLAYRDETRYSSRTEDWIEQGNTLFITIIPDEDTGCWIDTTRMKLVVNGHIVTATDTTDKGHAVFAIDPTNSITSSVYSTAYKDIVRLFTVELPNNESYYIITRNNEIEKTTVEYGKILSFRVVLNPDYDKSEGNYVVYVNGYAQVQDTNQSGMDPDANEFGYYDISTNRKGEVITEGGMQSDIKITVMGVAPNERVDLMQNIVSFIQEIFSVIKSIFDYFADIFQGIGNIGGGIGG